MRRTAALVYGQTGQSLTIRVPQGRPTSATFAVYRSYYDESTATAEWSGTATLDSVTTTLGTAAGPSQTDPRLLTLTTTGITEGTRYLLSQESVSEWVDVVQVGTSTIRTRFPIQHDYTTGATFKGATLSAAVDATWIATLANVSILVDTTPDYRVKWTIVVNGATIVLYSFFDVVRTLVGHQVEIADINARAFGLSDSLPVEYRDEDGRPIIDAAWSAVRAHLIAQGIQPDSWRDDEAIDELVILRSLRTLAEGGWHPPGVDLLAYQTMTTANYDRFFETHVVTLKHKTTTELDATTPYGGAPQRPIWSK